MEKLGTILSTIDNFVWGPVMLILLVGTGIFLTFRLKFKTWLNLGYSIKSTLSKQARQKSGDGDISPFSALTTTLASTIGTGNIVGVATAMVSGGPGALVWMWLSACFGLSSKFSECMLSIKYRDVNEKGEMSGGPMYTMKNGFKNKKLGSILGWLFAFFAVIASFGIGNMTQANSISNSLHSTFNIPLWIVGIILTVLAFVIIVGGIQTISKVSTVIVPFMAVFYIIAGLLVIIINYRNVPAGVAMIFKMAFSVKAVGGGLCGSITAAMINAMRFGIARGVFSNEAGMGSAAITATTLDDKEEANANYTYKFKDHQLVLTDENKEELTLTAKDGQSSIEGTWNDKKGNEYIFSEDGSYAYNSLISFDVTITKNPSLSISFCISVSFLLYDSRYPLLSYFNLNSFLYATISSFRLIFSSTFF